jgi:hypothetical protein
MAASCDYDDIFVVVWVLVILAELYLVYGGGTSASVAVMPTNEVWPFV